MNKRFRDLPEVTVGDFKLSMVQTCRKSMVVTCQKSTMVTCRKSKPLKTISKESNTNAVFRYLLNIPK